MLTQYLIITAVLTLCLVLAGRWAYRLLTGGSSACDGCALREACGKNRRPDKGRAEQCAERKPTDYHQNKS